MGAWGTGPLQNDGALDFMGELGRLPHGERVTRLREAFADYAAFAERLRAGINVSVLSPDEVAALEASRAAALEANAHDLKGLFELLPEYATEATWAEYVRSMAQPQVEDGASQAERAIAAAWAVAARLGAVDAGGQATYLKNVATDDVAALEVPAIEALRAIAANPMLRESRHGHASEWVASLEALATALARRR